MTDDNIHKFDKDKELARKALREMLDAYQESETAKFWRSMTSEAVVEILLSEKPEDKLNREMASLGHIIEAKDRGKFMRFVMDCIKRFRELRAAPAEGKEGDLIQVDFKKK